MASPTTNKFSLEVRDRAVRMVLEDKGKHAWHGAAIVWIAVRIGCSSPTLPEWMQKADRDRSRAPGVPSDVAGSAKPMIFRARRQRILPRRSSTAGSSHETINGLYKAEVIRRRGPWRSFEAAVFATLGWVN